MLSPHLPEFVTLPYSDAAYSGRRQTKDDVDNDFIWGRGRHDKADAASDE